MLGKYGHTLDNDCFIPFRNDGVAKEANTKTLSDWQPYRQLLKRASFLCFLCCLLNTSRAANGSTDEILARVADGTSKQRATPYSGLREYQLRNFRFDKQATITAQISYRPDAGMNYTILERTGSTKLLEILERVLESEADATRPNKIAEYEIGPENYESYLRGVEVMRGRNCFVIDLVPRHKNKYLIKGTAWIDESNYGVVRLRGVTAASVSMWIGRPHLELEFDEINGVWLPIDTGAVSSGLLLGTSELKIRYIDYLVKGGSASPGRGVDSVQQSRP